MEELTREQKEKYAVLQDYLRSLKSVAVAFSSGVDSTFLLKVAKDTLGDQVIAVTAESCSFPKRELNEAIFVKRKASNILSANLRNLTLKVLHRIRRIAVICVSMSCLRRFR